MRWYSLAIVLIILCLGKSLAAQSISRKGEIYESCIDSLFLREGVTQDLERNFEIMITVRAFHNICESEIQFTLSRRDESRPVVLSFMKIDGESAFQQLENSGGVGPSLEPDARCREIRMERAEKSSIEDPNLVSLLREFNSLRLSLRPPGDLIVEGSEYSVSVWSGFGQSTYHFYGLGWPRREGSKQDPLESWILEAFSNFDIPCSPLADNHRSDYEGN